MTVFGYVNDIVHKILMHPFFPFRSDRVVGKTAGLMGSCNYTHRSALHWRLLCASVYVCKGARVCMAVLVYELVKLDTRSCATVSG